MLVYTGRQGRVAASGGRCPPYSVAQPAPAVNVGRFPLHRAAWRLLPTLLAAFGSISAAAQPVQGDVRSVGFRASDATRYAVRYGQWFPILLELNVPATEHFQGSLRCEQVDVDGDRVAFVQTPVVLTAGGGLKRVWCYAVANADSPIQTPTVDILSGDGVLVHQLPLPAFETLPNDTLLILDISRRPVTKLRSLQSSGSSPEDNLAPDLYYRSVAVAEMPAAELPDRWFGLEAVDVIVWDQPEPAAVSPAQLKALVDWVRNGGELVVGVGGSWPGILKTSAFAEIMPLAGAGATVTVEALPQLFTKLGVPADRHRFDPPIPVTTARPRDDALRTLWDEVPESRTLVALWLVGSGRVTAVTVSLADVTRPMVAVFQQRQFFGELIDLNPLSDDFRKNLAQQTFTLMEPHRLYDGLVKPTEFGAVGSVFVLGAMGFVTVYVGLATLASWVWLTKHRLTHLSWSVFAAFAGAASLLGVGAVGLTRGVVGRTESMSLIDLEAGSTEARVLCLVGYKSPRRERADLSLPTEGEGGKPVTEGNYLRALARGPTGGNVYATPERYTAVPAKAFLEDTPMRATLKQFEGFWQGPLDGSIRGDLMASLRTGRITSTSWVENDLPVDVVGGYLLYLDPRRPDGAPYRAAGLVTSALEKYAGRKDIPPAVHVLAVRLPSIQSGSKVADLGKADYARYERELQRYVVRGNPPADERPELPTLRDVHLDWRPVGPLGLRATVDPTWQAALLASTRNFYLRNGSPEFDSVGPTITTAGLVDRDVSHWLLRGQAVLLLMVEAPGPARLCRDGRPLHVSGGRSLYRVRIPVRYER